MPVKKTSTSTKKSTSKKPTVKKSTVKKPTIKKTTSVTKKPTVKKSTTQKPTVIVKENFVKKTNYCIIKEKAFLGLIILLLLLLNTILLLSLVSRKSAEKAILQSEIEKVGGKENYDIIKNIYQMDIYKKNQKNRLDAAMTQLNNLVTNGKELPVTNGNDLSVGGDINSQQ